MTIEKIPYSTDVFPFPIIGKLNQVIDVVNSLTGGEKEEPKYNTLREKLGLIAFDGEVEEILSLVKEHLEKEMRKFGTQPPEAKIDMCEMSKIIKNL